ncbi:MAG TPA: MBL fold metallo-hydrolase [Candidatus Paceibacterota bacterium]|nr:MBL fold metallo-hydrolase [Candidatus Paceibacterota bacterium]
MKLTFYGGTKSVTGSNYILEEGGEKIMIDCGLIQGGDYAENPNFENFEYEPSEIKAVFATHAHIDHIGRLPKLVSDGFEGKVYSTKPTKGFAKHLLEDSVDILSREARKFDKSSFCTPGSIDSLMELWKGVGYGDTVEEGPFKVTFYNAGHILGSSFVRVEVGDKSVVFSGDLGNSPAPLIKEREPMPEADYVLMESTYGGEKHEPREKVVGELEDVIEKVVKNKGTLIIPSFALERTQALIYHIHDLMTDKKIPEMPVFLDSPLAMRLTDVYKSFKSKLDEETQEFLDEGHDLFEFPELHMTRTSKESKAIWNEGNPKIIIAGAGMSQGGRILHHEKRFLPGKENTILMVGYQVEGSLGRKILDGYDEVKIDGKSIPVNANVEYIPGYSAHADQPQLLEWLQSARFDLEKIYLVQGETDHMEPLKTKIMDDMAIPVEIPEKGQSIEL